MTIVALHSNNVAQYKGLFDTLSNLSEAPPISIDEIKKRISLLDQTGGKIFAGIVDNKIVACATLMIEYKIIRKGAKCGYVEDVATHKDHQGKGYGFQIVEHITNYAKSQDCYKVVLHCSEKVASFYERHNYIKKNVSMEVRF